MTFGRSRRALLALSLVLLTWNTGSAWGKTKTENVIFVMFDGMRWEDLFRGADEALLNKDRGGVVNVEETRKRFWRETEEERRNALMPFFWGVIAKEGQVYGNGTKNSVAKVTNGKNFSYPGYNEVLCGYPDDWVDSNDKIYNRNVTVLEWLNQKPEYRGRIAAYTTWDVFPFIINAPRSGIPVVSGFMPLTELMKNRQAALIAKLSKDAPLLNDNTRLDTFTYHAALVHFKTKKPKVLFLSFDETDSQGHAGRYDRVLHSANKEDGYLKELWETAQSMPEYKDKTSIILTTDHGRGLAPVEWKSHNDQIPGATYIWAAFMGPDTPALGERKNVGEITQSQIAATLAALLGEDYSGEVPKAAKPIADVIKTSD